MAVALTFALFVGWLLIGAATILLFQKPRNLLRTLLMAPSVGVAVVLLATVALNRIGLPVASFSVGLTITLLVASVIVLYWKRPLGSFRAYRVVAWHALPFVGVLLLAFWLSGRPLVEFGLYWLSVSNDDMANYVGDAKRFTEYGTYVPMDVPTYIAGVDYVQVYWVFAFAGFRLGTSPLLAWLVSLVGITGHQAFMPLTVAMHMGLAWATCALVLYGRKYRSIALLTGVVFTCSALSTLGVLYQLNPQVAGLALLAVAAVLLVRPLIWTRRAVAIREGLLIGIVVAGLFVSYPETLPFLGGALLIFQGVSRLRRQPTMALRPLVVAAVCAWASCLVLLNTYLVASMNYLFSQLGYGASGPTDPGAELFPYFRLPSGLANLWGYQAIAIVPPEPLQSATIILGALMLVAGTVAAVWLSWRLQPAACITLIMLLMGIVLFRQGAGFGLFKLAMFIQPFALATLVLAWAAWTGSQRALVRLAPLLVLGVFSLPAQASYVEASRGLGSTLVEVRNASATRVNEEFRELVRQVAQTPNPRLMIDTTGRVLAKFQSTYTAGIPTNFASRDPYSGFENTLPRPLLPENEAEAMQVFNAAMITHRPKTLFPWFPDSELPAYADLKLQNDPRTVFVNTLGQPSHTTVSCTHLISLTPEQSLFNRSHGQSGSLANFQAFPCALVQNHLMFVDSELGHGHYYFEHREPRLLSLFQLEDDPYAVGNTMAALGRRLLLQALNPTAQPRLALTYTNTLSGDGDNSMPPAVVIGETVQPLPLIGRGSARVFSPPLTPLSLLGRPYLGLDFGRDGQRFPDRRAGLMRLYGVDVQLDRRVVVGFGRDISLVTEEQYATLNAPSRISSFPADLLDPTLEYSGFYEDGWVAEAAFLGLRQPPQATRLVVRGSVPKIDDASLSTELQVLVDGRLVSVQRLGLGTFEVSAQVPAAATRRRIDLRFSTLQRLPGLDGRPVSAQMEMIGFEAPAATAPADIVAPGSGLIVGSNWHDIERTADGHPFRWFANHAELLAAPASGASRTLLLDIDAGPGLGGQPLQLQVVDAQGRVLATATSTGRQQIELTVPASADRMRLAIESPNVPTPNDPRILNARVFGATWKGDPGLDTPERGEPATLRTRAAP